jgi:hypothetical protein
MDDERFQQMEKRLNEQVEATRALNETLNKFIAIMSNEEAAKSVAPPAPVSTPLVITPLQASHPSRVKPGIPSNFDRDRAQGRAFITSCELYISLTAPDFIDEQVRIYWALSYFKGGLRSYLNSIGQASDALGQVCVTLRHPPLSCGQLVMGGLVLGGLVL